MISPPPPVAPLSPRHRGRKFPAEPKRATRESESSPSFPVYCWLLQYCDKRISSHFIPSSSFSVDYALETCCFQCFPPVSLVAFSRQQCLFGAGLSNSSFCWGEKNLHRGKAGWRRGATPEERYKTPVLPRQKEKKKKWADLHSL